MKDYKPLIERTQKLAEASPDNETVFLNALLGLLVEHGFVSARFYEVSKDPTENADVLVLRAYSYSSAKANPQAGLRIAIHNSTLGIAGLTSDLALGNPEQSPPSATQWIKSLNLEKDCWADIAIRDFNSELYGMLAVSMPTQYKFTPDDEFYLRLLRNIVGQFEANFRLRQIARIQKSISEFVGKTEFGLATANQIAELATRVILPISGGQACAVFRYDWPTRQLVKVAEYLDGKRSGTGKIVESYFPGQYLTGAAWEQVDLRHIPNFNSFMGKHPGLVYKESLEFHTKVLNSVESVLYEPFGNRHLRFFVRIINRKEAPHLPLSYAHKELLSSACEKLGEVTDELANRLVIKEFERIATSGIRHITDYSEALRMCCSAFDTLGFGNCAIFYQGKKSPQFELLHCGDPQLEKHLHTKLFVKDDSALIGKISSATGIIVTRLSDQPISSTDPVVNLLRSANVQALISACSSGDSGAILAVRCIFDSNSRLSPTTSLFATANDRDIIPAFLSIVAGVIDASRSNVSADFAETLVAHFGHEVATPITKLGSKAIAGVNRAIKILKDNNIGNDEIKKLEETKESINNQSHQINHQMKSAIALADRSAGSLDVNFQAFGWTTIINEAWEDAMEWKRSLDGRSSLRNIVLVRNPAISSLRSTGDIDLVRAILCNLFKNAVKYSLPRYGDSKAMEVRILGQPQTGIDIVQIENWGIGIPEDKWELIFEKFIRVERTDRLRAIRGMGLGLYISRLYAKVHSGDLFCRKSVSTLDDPDRNKQLEGYETQFELRLPQGMPHGVRKVRIN